MHGPDYEEGKGRVENYKQIASALKKRVMLASEDETTLTQKPCIPRSMSFEGQQYRIEHSGSRKRFSAYISMLWPDQKLMYYFYDKMNSINTIDYLKKLRKHVIKSKCERLSHQLRQLPVDLLLFSPLG